MNAYMNACQGLKVPNELKAIFDDLSTASVTLQFKVDAFSRSLQAEARAIAVAYKDTWDEAKAVMELHGDWRYEDGMVYPLSLSEMVTPNV